VLGQSKDSKGFPYVVKALEDVDLEVRSNALEALAFFGSRAVETLIKELKNPNQNRARIIEILGTIGDQRCYKVLRLVLVQAKSFYSRVQAAEALAKFGESAVDPLIGSLSDPDCYVRLRVIDLLVEIGNRSTVVHIQRCCFDQSRIVRESAKNAVEKLTTPQKEGLKFVVKED